MEVLDVVTLDNNKKYTVLDISIIGNVKYITLVNVSDSDDILICKEKVVGNEVILAKASEDEKNKLGKKLINDVRGVGYGRRIYSNKY